jgi:endo-1,4-beta-xylanase
MASRILGLSLIVILLLASCTTTPTPSSNTTTFLPTDAPTAEPSVTETGLPVPSAMVVGRALLFAGPEMDYCSAPVIVPEDTRVDVLGTYKDFVAVQYQDGDTVQHGYLPKVNLSELPVSTPELTSADVPGKMVVDYTGWSYYDPAVDGFVVSPPSDSHSDDVSDGTHHLLQAPLRVHFGLQLAPGTPWGDVKFSGSTDNSSGEVWWKNLLRMDVAIDSGKYGLCVRDGSSEGCTDFIPVPIPSDQEITFLFLDSFGKHLQVLNAADQVVVDVDLSKQPGLNLPNGLFPEGWYRFGTTVGSPGTLTVSHLSLTTVPSGIYQASWLSETGLSERAAQKGILIGTEFHPDRMLDQRYCEVLRHDFNLAALSPFTQADLWLGPGNYDFDTLDYVVDGSLQYGLTLYGSHLVWGSYDEGVLPEWLKKGNFTRDEYLTILHDHITTLVSRYKGRVKIWSIANEAPERDRYQGTDFWYDHIGSEYIEKSFEWAHQADPDAILILNAANNESPRDADTTYNINTLYRMVSEMKAKGVPIGAVGMQMHLFLPWSSHVIPTEADVEATMKKFGALGVKVMITELDVNLHEIPGTEQEKVDLQTKLYGDMMTACVNSSVCTAFMTWGVNDSESWITLPFGWVYPTAMPDAAPLLFDTEFQPKPAYFAVLKILNGK